MGEGLGGLVRRGHLPAGKPALRNADIPVGGRGRGAFKLANSWPRLAHFQNAIATMQERMKLCPISRNLPESVGKRIELSSLG